MSGFTSAHTKYAYLTELRAQQVEAGIASISELRILGEPQSMIVCFDSPVCNIYRIGDALTHKVCHC
jgi:hypothetical protein